MAQFTAFRGTKQRLGWVHGVIAAIFAITVACLGPGVVWADTVQYIRIAHELQGESADDAWRAAYTEFCRNPSIPYQGTVENCVTTTMAGRGPIIGYVDRNPQYQEIFSPRIGYPLMAIPLMNWLGDRTGLWLISILSITVAGLLFTRLARLAGLPRVPAIIAQIAFYLLPVSIPHGIALLAEAPTLAASLVLAMGFAYVLRRRTVLGVVLAVPGLGLVLFFKYSSMLLLCVSIVLVCLMLLLFRTLRARSELRVATLLSVALLLVTLGLNALFSFPGLEHSLQDTFTDHFRLPPVSDPVQRLIALEFDFLNSFVADILENLGYFSVLAAGVMGIVLALRARSFDLSGWPLIALALYGVLSVVGHPVYSQAERLGSSIWVVAALGVGFLAWFLFSLGGQRKASDDGGAGRRRRDQLT
ncbi:hypothetical protein QFZ52_002018 [Arthrobacter woluwensis]|uniref:hypothetical protein n=1 Tax=Arthrobacter woluwensis TaxID=156980 RepID=UPI00278A4853|nr:hypothetical protein [Arthrobacter woluwensis]MDQ0709366.1 hypothetical protein [Arthrobacter woluwensis]